MDKQEAIDNLRVTVRASLAVVPQPTWQSFASEYMKHTEPTMDEHGRIWDIVNDRLDTFGGGSGMHPIIPARREWYCCKVVYHILLALDYYRKANWVNSTMECQEALTQMRNICKLTKQSVEAFCSQVARSLYGADAIVEN